MINHAIPFLVGILFLTSAFASKTYNGKEPASAPVSLGEFLYTVPLQKEVSPQYAQTQWYHDFLEPDVNDSVFVPLIDQLITRSAEVYAPEYPFTRKLSPDEAIQSIQRFDTVLIEDPETFDLLSVLVENRKHAEDIVSVTFHEEWFFDAATLTLNKTVKGFIPNINWGWDANMVNVVKPSVYVKCNNQDATEARVNVQGITCGFYPDGTGHVNAVYTSNVVIDPRAVANQNKAQQNILEATKMKCAEKKFKLFTADYPNTTPLGKDARVKCVQELNSCNHLRFSENWEIDMRKHIFRKKVLGVIPANETKSEDQQFPTWNYRYSVFVPFNNFVPVVSPVKVCEVDRFSFGVNYQSNSNVTYPVIQTSDSAAIAGMANSIKESVMSNRFTVYNTGRKWLTEDFWSSNHLVKLSAKDARGLFVRVDSIFVEDYGSGYTEAREYEIGEEYIAGFRFYESWIFDPSKLSFDKKIHAIGLNEFVMDGYWESVRGVMSKFFYYNPVGPIDSIYNSRYKVATDVICPVMINHNEFNSNESDNGGQVISYYNSYDENIHASQRYHFIQPMIDLVLSGKLEARADYKTVKPLSTMDVRTIIDTAAAKSKFTLVKGMEYAFFNYLYFHEDWYFNKSNGRMYKVVKAITFAHRGLDFYDQNDIVRMNIIPCFTVMLKNGK